MKKLLFFIGLCSLCLQARCEDITFINSDHTKYTENSVSCTGNVIIVYCGRIISADYVSYDKNKRSVTANGHVIIKDELLNTYFLDSLYVEKDFVSGKVKNIKIISNDKSRLAATDGEIKDGKFQLNNTIFTPCYICSDSDEVTWQLKSSSVIFDPQEYTQYKDVVFEAFGVPVVYTPYFTHVSPTVKRKSGFLVPKVSLSSSSGFSILPQYLFSISESQELILKPIVTSKIGQVGWAYYAIRFPHGEFNVDASITGTKSVSDQTAANPIAQSDINKIKSSGYRGHIFSTGRYEINDIWRSSFNLNLVSDNFYMKRFPFFKEIDRTLESNVKLEGFDGDNYTLVKTAMFQGETCETAPKILPVIERNYLHDFLGGTFGLDSMFMNSDFRHGRSARKFVSSPSWRKKVMFPFGNIFELMGTVSLRALNVSEKQHSEYDSSFTVTPQIKCLWEWPLLLSNSVMDTIFTPIAGAIIASNKKCHDIFEDQFNDLNDINLFDGNRSISTYNIDTGKRIFYGARMAGYDEGAQIYRLIVGQSYELTATPEDRTEVSGLKHKNSNVVSSCDIFLSEQLTFLIYGSYSPQNKDWTKLEAGINFVHKGFSADIFGFKGKQCFYDPFAALPSELTEEQKTQRYKGVMLDFGWEATNYFKLKSGVTLGNKCEDLRIKTDDDDFKLIKYHVGFEYKNECTSVEAILERKNYKSGDLKPETSFRVVVHLKNLGI